MVAPNLFTRFAALLRDHSPANLVSPKGIDDRLLLDREGTLSIFYAPFDWTNESARIVLVGITPGRTQMANAVAEAHRQLTLGADEVTALRKAKMTGAFSGSMRSNLIAMLDYFGLNRWLNVRSTADLFAGSAGLLHTTSLLRFPTFVGVENFNGTPAILRTAFLRKNLAKYFVPELQHLQRAVIVPLGDKVTEVLEWLAAEGAVSGEMVLSGLPHPSGANAERIHYLIERKGREALSAKTDARKLDEARARLTDAVARLLKGALPNGAPTR